MNDDRNDFARPAPNRPTLLNEIMKTNSKYNTEPPHCINFVLCVVPAILRIAHSCTGYGCASASADRASVWLKNSKLKVI